MSTSSVDLTVIIPTLRKQATARLIGERIREICRGLNVEVIIVAPDLPAEPGQGIRYLRDHGRGVYRAYSQGLKEASGEYVWFVGDDDYPLEGAASLVEHLRARCADILVAPVVFGDGRLYRPRRGRFLLLFYNWCQQGVIYRRSVLERHKLHRRLRVLADHYTNIRARSDSGIKIRFTAEPVCVFGIQGLSATVRDEKFHALLPALARRTLGTGGFLLFCAANGFRRMRQRARRIRTMKSVSRPPDA